MDSNVFEKDPAENKFDCFFDWTDWLEVGESITGYTITVPTGITKVSDSISGSVVAVRLAGGELEHNYAVKCQVEINGVVGADRDPVRRIFIKVLEK